MKGKSLAIVYAVLAALFYAINTPISKILLSDVPVTFMASFLYFGAGVGVGIMYLFHWKKERAEERLVKSDLPYTVGMVLLDIAAPIFMLIGTGFVVWDTMTKWHKHLHTHTITHTHNAVTHTHVVEHSHPHNHSSDEEKHDHKHSERVIENMLSQIHKG